MSNASAWAIDPELTQIAIGYRNREMIADRVLPRISQLGQSEFKYQFYPMEQGFTVPNTLVGRRSQVPEVNFKSEERTAAAEDYGLEHALPQRDVDNAPEGTNPMGRVTEWLTNLIELDRELRVAQMVFNSNTYGTSNKVALSGADQFTDGSSDPVRLMLEKMDLVIMRPNRVVFGQGVWREFRQHPKVVKATNRNSGDSGVAAREAVAELLEVEEVIVGRALVNSARIGQPAQMQQAWGNHVAMLHIDRLADTQQGATFGFTAPYGQREGAQWFDRNVGTKGGTRVRVAESLAEVVSAPDLGFLIQNAI